MAQPRLARPPAASSAGAAAPAALLARALIFAIFAIFVSLAPLAAASTAGGDHPHRKVHRKASAPASATARSAVRSTAGSTARSGAGNAAAGNATAGNAAAGASAAALPPGAKTRRVPLDSGLEAAIGADGQITVEALPRRGEGLTDFAHRLCGDSRFAPQLLEANHRRGLQVAMRYHVPYALLSTDWQLKAAQKLFPEDRGEATGWRHEVRGLGPLQRESLWQISEWFTGQGENFRAIRDHNRLRDEELPRGTVLTIPSEMLRPAFGPALPVPQKPFQLDFGRDAEGDYAVYQLRPGEALYSGVVVRFTGRIYAADVNALAAEIAQRNAIEDVTNIPAGFAVKIPLELVQPEFLPEGDPRRKEYEAGLRASAQFSNQVRARDLEGITIILDAGHGGHDSGAALAGVWESLYVYDIALRVRQLLAARTAASVHLTTRDGDEFRIVESDVLPQSRRHAVLTNPPYPIADPAIGVNLRWYLANSVYRRAISADDNPQKVVFLSIHADSLHPSLRGAMAYIPAARMGGSSFGKTGPVYELRAEFRESPEVHLPLAQRRESEGLSRELAKQVVAAFQERALPVHPFDPVRDRIIRNRSEWVPAVLRFNTVPAKMLLEVCNLNNDRDRQLLQTRGYRQKVSEAIVAGLLAYYGAAGTSPGVHVAKALR